MAKKILGHLFDSYAVCTKEHVRAVSDLLKDAHTALANLSLISSMDIEYLGMEQELERLKRNASSLIWLLSMVSDAQEYIKRGINAIGTADVEYWKEEERKFNEKKERILRSQEYKKKNDRFRHKDEAENK